MSSPSIICVDNMPINIFWHIFIDEKGYIRGKDIIERQFKKILYSGLYDRCDTIYIGYVSDNIVFPSEYILSYPKVKIIVNKNFGYEGVTTTELKKFCDSHNNCLIMYIHNRGMSHNEDSPSEDWTLMMEYFVILRWKQSIQHLNDKYTCGCEMWSHTHRYYGGNFTYHYSGNFWWSRSEYIKLLDFPLFNDRYSESEDWILRKVGNEIPKEYFGVLHRTSMNKYERGMVHSYIDRYPFKYYQHGNETPDIEIDKSKFHGEHCFGN